MEPGKWNQPKNAPQCLLCHLETFVWTRPDWLGNARHLTKATFIIDHIEPKKLFRLAKRREMLNVLPDVVRASNSCQLVFESE
ncbi:hypothetical protein IGI04_035737 [Brassica rapa subsp. trilocularis]|uniref:FBD domain-containing protein n=1 Tax=Brassica rapa subsp. trilocularis TaxID=1813537 RepID=A0ABQ7LDE5_BRACM|nr:hypothetical protein IGI04_035737 [Brassica rapa subsp. trilocularis]